MAIDALLSRLEARPVVTSVTSRPAPAVTRKPAPALACTSVTSVTAESHNARAEAETAYWAWLVRYPSGAAFRCHFTPEQTRSQVKAAHPQAVSVEPLPDEATAQAMPLHSKDERAVRAWLAAIGETDPELIDEFMERCRRDPEALAYALRESAPKQIPHEINILGFDSNGFKGEQKTPQTRQHAPCNCLATIPGHCAHVLRDAIGRHLW